MSAMAVGLVRAVVSLTWQTRSEANVMVGLESRPRQAASLVAESDPSRYWQRFAQEPTGLPSSAATYAIIRE